MSRWEPADPTRRQWGVMNVEAPDADPIAVFREEAHARIWLAQMQQHLNDDERLSDYYGVFAVGVDRMIFWNSYDPAPEETPTYEEVACG